MTPAPDPRAAGGGPRSPHHRAGPWPTRPGPSRNHRLRSAGPARPRSREPAGRQRPGRGRVGDDAARMLGPRGGARHCTVAVTGAMCPLLVGGHAVAFGGHRSQFRRERCSPSARHWDGLRNYLAASPVVLWWTRFWAADRRTPCPGWARNCWRTVPCCRSGPPQGRASGVDVVLWNPMPDPVVLGCAPGPRADWLTREGIGRV